MSPGLEGELPLLVYGAGGMGRELAWQATSARERRRVVAYVDDDAASAGRNLHGIEVLSLADATDRYPGAYFIASAGSVRGRRSMVARAIDAGLRADTLVHDSVIISAHVAVGEGCVICAGCIVTVDIQLGRFVQVNLDCTVTHDSVLEDYVTLAPGVHVSGNVRIEQGAYLGTGATIINGHPGQPLVIGAGATIGAGAVVTKSIPAGRTAVGVPARALARRGPAG